MQPVTFTLVGDLFDVHERGRMQGVFGAVWGVAGLAGPFVGGWIVHSVGWRWIFWVNLPFGLASAAVLAVAYHERPERHRHRLDLAGAALLSIAVVAALLAARSAGAGLVSIPVAAAAAAAFLAVERRAREPLLPLDLFSTRVMVVGSAAGALMGAAMFTTVTYVPLWVQSVLGGTPITAAALRPGTPLPAVQALMAAYGAGLGIANPPLLIAIQTSVPWNRRGVATASTLFFRTIGGTLAVGLLGGALAHALAGAGARPELVEALLGPGRHLLDASAVASVAAALQGAMGAVFWTGAAIACAAFAVALAFPHVPIAARAPEAG
jgi:hypothetical protein